jgi:hypothetical protein
MRLKITPGVDGKLTAVTDKVVVVNFDLDSNREERVFLYVSLIRHYDIIVWTLGM